MIKKNRLQPGELVKKYPALLKRGWDASALGFFFSKGILTGVRGKDFALIDEDSLIRLARYADGIIDESKLRLSEVVTVLFEGLTEP